MTLEIQKVLLATTGHVTEEERDILNANGYSRGEYGWLIFINPNADPSVSEIEEPSEGLAGAMRVAKENGCRYLLLDRDAQELEGLPVYEW